MNTIKYQSLQSQKIAKIGANMKFKTTLAAAVFGIGLFAGLAEAAPPPKDPNPSPHFIDNGSSVDINEDGALVVTWKEAGLGDNTNVTYELTADATASYACINKGDNMPQADNKAAVSGDVFAGITLSSNKNGNITGSLKAGPLPPPGKKEFNCGAGQKKVLLEVGYTNIALTDTTNDLDAPLPVTQISATCDTSCLGNSCVTVCQVD